jgi:hypothetical protein
MNELLIFRPLDRVPRLAQDRLLEDVPGGRWVGWQCVVSAAVVLPRCVGVLVKDGWLLRLAGLARGAPVVAASVLVSMVFAGGGQAAASGLGGGQMAGVISTVAGGPGGPAVATTVALPYPCGVAFGGGLAYLANTSTVQALNPSGWLNPVAGSATPRGQAGNGTPAASASLDTCSVAVDEAGNLVIAGNAGYNKVQVAAARSGVFYGKSMRPGHVYTVAGVGRGGFSGDGGPATSAELKDPAGVAVDSAGNLVIADTRNSRVRVVAAATGTFYGQAMTAGDIYTVAGNGQHGYAGNGGLATGAKLYYAQGVAVDGAGNLVIADTSNYRVRVVAAATGTFYGRSMTAGHIYTVAGDGTGGFSGDGGPATSAGLFNPSAVAVDGAGNLVIADTLNSRVRVVAASTGMFYGQSMTAGDIYTVAGDGTGGYSGDGGPATSAELQQPRGVAVDGAGNLVIADYGNYRVRVVAASTGTFYGQSMTAGDIYTVAGDGNPYGFSGDGGPATSAELSFPQAVAVDGAGNLLIADTVNDRVRVVAAATGTLFGQSMTAGDIYTVAGDGTGGYSGDGGPATSTELDAPRGVAVDGAGNLVIADTANYRVRVVAAATGTFYGQSMTAGDVYTVAGDGPGGFSGDGGPATSAELEPQGVAVDGAGNLVIADLGNDRVRVVAAATGTFYGQAMTAGDIYTVAGNGTYGYSGDGGPATSAELFNPTAVAVDGAGNLVIADTRNYRVRVVAAATGTFYGQAMTAGDIYTVAGNGTFGYGGDGGPATSAELEPGGVAVDGAGNLVILDSGSDRVRVVAAATGTFYGQAMTAGDIYTVAGNEDYGYSGDGGPATSAKLYSPEGVAVDGAGNLVIADTYNNRVRTVAG